jgi:tartrate dehydratase beta subunit/fumarate hydratase class I family protein
MRRLVLSLCLGLAFVSSANAGCITTQETMGIIDEGLMHKMVRIGVLNPQESEQIENLMTKGYKDGLIVLIPKGTRIDNAVDPKKIFKAFTRVNIRGASVFILDNSFSCD